MKPYYCVICKTIIWTEYTPSTKRPIWTYCLHCKKQTEHEYTNNDVHPDCLRICGRINSCSTPNISDFPVRVCNRMESEGI